MFDIKHLKNHRHSQFLLLPLLVAVSLSIPAVSYSPQQVIRHATGDADPFFSPDGNQLIILEQDKVAIYVLQGNSFVQVQTITTGFKITDVAWSADSSTLAIRYFTNLDIYIEKDGKYVMNQEIILDDLLPASRLGLRFCKNQKFLFSPQNSEILIYKKNENSSQYQQKSSLSRTGTFTKISVSQDCSKLLVSDSQQTQIFILEQGNEIDSFYFAAVQCKNILALSSDGSFAFTEFNDTMLYWRQSEQTYIPEALQIQVSPATSVIRATKSLSMLAIATNQDVSIVQKRDGVFRTIFRSNMNVKHDTRPVVDISATGKRFAFTSTNQYGTHQTWIYKLKIDIQIWNNKQESNLMILIGMIGLAIMVTIVIIQRICISDPDQNKYSQAGHMYS